MVLLLLFSSIDMFRVPQSTNPPRSPPSSYNRPFNLRTVSPRTTYSIVSPMTGQGSLVFSLKYYTFSRGTVDVSSYNKYSTYLLSKELLICRAEELGDKTNSLNVKHITQYRLMNQESLSLETIPFNEELPNIHWPWSRESWFIQNETYLSVC